MKALKYLFNFYINSSIHVALAVYSLTCLTLLELGLEYDETILYFIFYASITGYNFVKYFGVARFRNRKLANWLRLVQVLSIICFLLMCFYAYRLQFKTLVIIGFFGVLTFFYAIPFIRNEHYTLRKVYGLKVYVIALVWAGTSVFLPVINENYILNADVFLLGAQRFIYVLVLMIPFEIRDLKFDSVKLRTVPQKIGVRHSKLLGVILLLVLFVLEFFKDQMRYSNVIALLLIATITGVFVVFSKTEQGKYYSSFWVEGLPILWLALLLIFR